MFKIRIVFIFFLPCVSKLLSGNNFFARETAHHEMLHLGQYIRNPNLLHYGLKGRVHEMLPPLLGNSGMWGSVVGLSYGLYKLNTNYYKNSNRK